MTGRCATCRFAVKGWDTPRELRCAAVVFGTLPGEPLAQLYVEAYGEVEGFGLHVSPDFGCVMWEAK